MTKKSHASEATASSNRGLRAIVRFYSGFNDTAVKRYLTGSAAALLAKIMSLVAGFGNLWLLTQILAKEQFAAYAFTLALIVWLAVVGTGGLDRTILFRLSRVDAEGDRLVGGPLVAAALLATLPLSAALGAVIALGIFLGGFEPLPDFGFWMAVFAPVIVTTCVGRVFEAWYWAQGRIALTVLVPACGEIARTACLFVAFFALPTKTGVALAVLAAALVPLVIWLAVAPLGGLRHPARISRYEIMYGLKIMLARTTQEGTLQIDIFLIGLLATAAATADYVVAARIAIMVALVKGVLAPVLTPRIGRYSALGRRAALLREYNQTRLLALFAALVAASIVAAFGRPLLSVFGDFQQSYPLLMILVAGYVVSVGFGSNVTFLTIVGHAGWTLATRVMLLVGIVALNLVLIPALGAIGAALGMAVGMVAVNASMCFIIWRLDRLATISLGLVILLGMAYSLLLLVGFGVLPGGLAALALGALAGTLLVLQTPLWLPQAKRLFQATMRYLPSNTRAG